MKEAINKVLREHQRSLKPSAMVSLLEELRGEPLDQVAFIFAFAQAFSEIPLRVVHEASGWIRFCEGGVDDEEFNRMLGPWIGPDSGQSVG